MNKAEEAAARFKKGFNCAQAVLSVFGPSLGLDKEKALQVAGAFGGGMALMGEVCGAVTGAFMVIGLKYGKVRAEDDLSKERTYRTTLEFVQRFKARHGSILCKRLLHHNISTPRGMEAAKKEKLFTTLCPQLVRDAAVILEEIL